MEEEKISKIIMFDGSEAKWREWSKKFLARARISKLVDVLKGSAQVPREDIPEDELSTGETSARKANDAAYNLLILSMEGTALC